MLCNSFWLSLNHQLNLIINNLNLSIMIGFKKNYIGKGTQVPNMSIAKCTVNVAELLKHVHIFKDEEYVTFEVAKLQSRDKFGKDYTVYCTTRIETDEKKPAPASGNRRRKKEAATV